MRSGIKIGELAKACAVSRDTIRFYERESLLPPAGRTASRHRLYDEATVKTLLFIRKAQELGLTLSDIRDLLKARILPAPDRCRLVSGRLRQRMQEHDRKIAALKAERGRLKRSLERCEASRPQECPLMADLVLEPAPARRKQRGRRTDTK
jgi:MerR family Zn(II)-responsive transcriptional regulator of zntA